MTRRIISIQHENKVRVWGSLEDFCLSNFRFEVSDNGQVSLNFEVQSISYAVRVGGYTKEEIFKDFVRSSCFKKYWQSKGFEVYKAELID